jgi:His-Xaa-Ser system protein HxsD
MSENVIVGFKADAQDRAALDAAAYRLIGTASCHIEMVGDSWICELTSNPPSPAVSSLSADELRARFLDLVTDENLRERIAGRTERIRDVILALAFGAAATSQEQSK